MAQASQDSKWINITNVNVDLLWVCFDVVVGYFCCKVLVKRGSINRLLTHVTAIHQQIKHTLRLFTAAYNYFWKAQEHQQLDVGYAPDLLDLVVKLHRKQSARVRTGNSWLVLSIKDVLYNWRTGGATSKWFLGWQSGGGRKRPVLITKPVILKFITTTWTTTDVNDHNRFLSILVFHARNIKCMRQLFEGLHVTALWPAKPYSWVDA